MYDALYVFLRRVHGLHAELHPILHRLHFLYRLYTELHSILYRLHLLHRLHIADIRRGSGVDELGADLDADAPLRVQETLWLERGQCEALVVNPSCGRPVYVDHGREYVRRVLDAVAEFPNHRSLLQEFPDAEGLLHLLEMHEIVVKGDRGSGCGQSLAPRCASTSTGDCGKSAQRRHVSVYLLLTHDCNFGCVYCLDGARTQMRPACSRMPRETAGAALRACAAQVATGGRLEVVFFGGEPLLNWNLAREIIAFCETKLRVEYPGRDVHYHLTSNLSCLPDDFADLALKHSITVLCDLDGPPDVQNAMRPYADGSPSYDHVARNIRTLVDAGVGIALRCTVTSNNVRRMSEVAEHHKMLGASSTAFVPVNPVTSDEDILPFELLPNPDLFCRGLVEVFGSGVFPPEQVFPFNSYLDRVKGGLRMQHGCGAPYGNTPVVNASGEVFPCIYLVGLARFNLGSVLDGSYPRDEVLEELSRSLDVDSLHRCRACPWRYYCGGGCPVGKLTVEDNSNATKAVVRYVRDIACGTTRAVVENLLWHYVDRGEQ